MATFVWRAWLNKREGSNMPIYEYYCPDCHMLLNFFARGTNATRQPSCPHCKRRRLKREVSLFAAVKGGRGGDDEEGGMDDLPIDETRMESAIETLAADAESINEEDPRAAAQLMRKFSNLTGLEFNAGMQEALDRMEAGEDPDQIEQEMGDLMDGEEPFVLGGGGKGKPGKRGARGIGAPPRRDPKLYDL
jgi:putative FmdB family regulatory protein